MEKLFMTTEEVAADLDIEIREARKLVQELGERVRRNGGFYIAGVVQTAYYEKMKSTCFLSPNGVERADPPLSEKRLLRLKEFCAYSGLGQNMARKFAKQIGIEKRIGHKVLYDREQFDRWCDENSSADI